MRKGTVFMNEIEVGTISETDYGKYIFVYSPDYLQRNDKMPVSITFPLQEDPFVSDHLFSFFFNMLSEGENRQIQSSLLGIDQDDDFGILLATCSVDTPGAVTIKPM